MHVTEPEEEQMEINNTKSISTTSFGGLCAALAASLPTPNPVESSL